MNDNKGIVENMDKTIAVEYKEATEYILSIPKFTVKTELSNTKHFLNLMGNPEKDIPVLHVAGTNGKGSVCKMLAGFAEAAGLRAGLFISPHLIRINERISVNGQDISDEDFVRLYKLLKELVLGEIDAGERASLSEGLSIAHPAYFEFLFLMAAMYFKEQNCDVIIYETGLGGRLDATSSVEPAICGITSIGMDHMQYLGNTVEEIAAEKAGIIREGVPVVINTGSIAADNVIEEVAKEKNAPLYNMAKESAPDSSNDASLLLGKGQPLYQLDNARTASKIFELFMEQRNDVLKKNGGKTYTEEEIAAFIKEGLSGFNWPGRMQWLAPNVVIDGAHNEDAIERFVESINNIVETSDKFEKISLLFAVSSDKDYEKMIELICQNLPIEDVYISEINSDRKTDIQSVMSLFSDNLPPEKKNNVYGSSSLKRMYDLSKSELDDSTILAVVGSLYMVGEILSWN